MVSGSNNA
jgi:hypothetical protein